MKKIKPALILIICLTFVYVTVEQKFGVGAIYEILYASDTVPVSLTSDIPFYQGKQKPNELDNGSFYIYQDDNDFILENKKPGEISDTTQESESAIYVSSDNTVQIVVTAAGDCLLGRDDSFGLAGSFDDEYERNNKNPGYFLENFADLFNSSDLTIVNLEAPLTVSTEKAEKEFAFKGLPEFTEILKAGNVDAVTIANNHTKDYGIIGYDETIKNLEKASILYFGNEYTALTEVSGIKIGMFGYSAWYVDNYIKKNISKQIEKLREMGADLVIAYFHWGDERAELPNEVQKTYAHYTIDSGADLVLGTHPHVIQGIEEYKGKQIIYSFGNFCYGGAKYPSDKDTYVFQQTFTFIDGELVQDANIKIIPTSISSVTERNNYQPTPLTGDELERVAEKIINRSSDFNSADKLWRAMGF